MNFQDALRLVIHYFMTNNPDVKRLADCSKPTKEIFADDYTEYELTENDFGIACLRKVNVELIGFQVWMIPIESEEKFFQLMELLDKPTQP